MIWLDPLDPQVRCAVYTGVWGRECDEIPEHAIDTIEVALQVASDILTHLTGFKVHPAGHSAEDFVAQAQTYKLTPICLPIREVISLQRLGDDGVFDAVTEQFAIFGQSVYFSGDRTSTYADWLWRACHSKIRHGEMLRLTYRFGSTITSSARRAVVHFAHQLWLEAEGSEECQLPSRVTTVNREGLSYTMLDPQDYLERGRTGLPLVDLWLAAVNPSRARQPARVITPEMPVPVNIGIRTVRS